MDKLRVLVLDDKEKNLDAARQQLGDNYELTLEKDWCRGCGGLEDIDVVLTDLMFPMGNIGRIGEHCDPTKEGPYGFLNMLAAIKAGVKYVALVTGGDPHVDPIAAMIGEFATHSGPIQIGDTRLIVVQQYDYREGSTKDWLNVLRELTEAEPFDYKQDHLELRARLKETK